MREKWPFRADDLEELDRNLLSKAARVVAMEDVHDGERAPNVIALRHDCDAGHSLQTAVKMARWEHDRGYRSTYYLLHSSPYWTAREFPDLVERISLFGHEIGIHANGIAEAFRTGEHPDAILERALDRLRGLGHKVRGTAGHGDPLCRRDRMEHEEWFANDEQFLECAQMRKREPTRELSRGATTITLWPRPLGDFGLEYEALCCALPYHWRCSDSGGRWMDPGFEETAERFASQADVTVPPAATGDRRQLHLLIHPDWWAASFPRVPVAEPAT